jgi:serine phosphatase RsbU (regulator of sigma subunit)/tetratricopeptide (TPR) repeat protein
MKFYSLSCIFISLLCAFSRLVFAQDDLLARLNKAQTDVDKCNILNELAAYETKAKNYEKAVLYGQQALDLATKSSNNLLKGNSLRSVGRAYQGQNDFSAALNYYLQSVMIFETANDSKQLAEDHYDIAMLYNQRNAYQKSVDNLQKSIKYYQAAKDSDGEEKALNRLGDAYLALKDYNNATNSYSKLIEAYRKKGNNNGVAATLSKLAALNKINNNFDNALKFSEEKFQLHKANNQKVEAAFAANNVGFLYRQKNDNNKSVEYFNQALDLFKQASAERKDKSAIIYNNIGVTYTNLGDYRKAANYYNEVLRMNEEKKSYPDIAGSYNYLAANDYISANNDQALFNVQKAIEIGEANKCTAQLVESYQILSEIYAKDNDFKRSQEAFKKHQELKDLLAQEQKKQDEAIQQTQLEAEKKESEFKLLIADKQKQELTVNQLKLEAEKATKDLELQEKQVTLLRQEKDLQTATLERQKLEREKVQRDKELAQQQLALAQQQLEDEKQKQQIANLEKEKAIQDLEKQDQLKAMQLIQAEKAMQQQQIEDEKEIRKYFYAAAALFILVLLVIAVAFIQKQRANHKLAKQKKLIEQKNEALEASELEIKKNLAELQGAYAIIKESEEEIRQKNEELQASEEELRQNMEELQATYEVIETQKDQLESQNMRMTQSIRYAERIQAAILPTLATRKAVFPENFLVYKPKDIVSGDFFWVSEEDNVKVAAVIDCTGHGVPGAFMSMIGYTILNDTINKNNVTSPAEILKNLNKEVKKRLKQSEGANNDGMDLGICVFRKSDNGFTMTYGGAKHKLFVWTNNELQEVKSDRKMIGGVGVDENQDFSEITMELQKGDVVYLTTDGYIDQADETRHSFGPIRFKSLIQDVAKLPMEEQGEAFHHALQEHQKDTEQRDDITVLGVKLS